MVGDKETLVVQPQPYPGESLTGFIARVAKENWFSRIVLFERIARVKLPNVALDAGGLERLAELTGAEISDLHARQYALVGEDGTLRHFLGDQVNQSHLKTTAMRYCPVCLGGSVERPGYHRAIWELRLIDACPLHGLRLVSLDPKSGKEISWVRPELTTTQFGELPLADEAGHKRILSDEELLGQRAIYEKCRQEHGGRSVLAGLPDAVRQMSLDEFLKVIVVLGAARLGAPDFSGARRIYAHNLDMLALTAGGVYLLEGWPARFGEYLEGELESAGIAAGSAGLSRLFEDMFKRMKKLEDGPAKAFLQKGTNDCLAELRVPINRKNSNFVRGDDRNGRNFLTLVEAAELLGVSTYRARQIAEEEGWIERDKKTTHVTNLLPRHLVESYEIAEPVICSHSEAMELLGVLKSALRAFATYGLLVERPNKYDRRSAKCFLRSEVEGLLKRLRDSAPIGMIEPGDREEIDLLQLSIRIAPPRHTLGMLAARVLDGTLVPVRWDDEIGGVYAMRFDARKIAEYREQIGSKMPASIRASRAVRRYGYSLEELAWFAEERLIKVAEWRPAFADSDLVSADLQGFSRRHVLERQAGALELGVDCELVAESEDLGRLYRIEEVNPVPMGRWSR